VCNPIRDKGPATFRIEPARLPAVVPVPAAGHHYAAYRQAVMEWSGIRAAAGLAAKQIRWRKTQGRQSSRRACFDENASQGRNKRKLDSTAHPPKSRG